MRQLSIICHLLDPPPFSTFKVVTTVDFKRYRYLFYKCSKSLQRSSLQLHPKISWKIVSWSVIHHPQHYVYCGINAFKSLCAISQRYLQFCWCFLRRICTVSLRSERIERFIEGLSFLAVGWFGSTPAPSPVSKSSLFLSLPVCRRSSLLRGGGGRGAESYDRKKAWASINCSNLSWYGTRAFFKG
jgi:hypothetical protein